MKTPRETIEWALEVLWQEYEDTDNAGDSLRDGIAAAREWLGRASTAIGLVCDRAELEREKKRMRER